MAWMLSPPQLTTSPRTRSVNVLSRARICIPADCNRAPSRSADLVCETAVLCMSVDAPMLQLALSHIRAYPLCSHFSKAFSKVVKVLKSPSVSLAVAWLPVSSPSMAPATIGAWLNACSTYVADATKYFV